MTTTTAESEVAITCSFCGKSRNEVRTVITGPNVAICDECVDLCNDIIERQCAREESQLAREYARPRACAVCNDSCFPRNWSSSLRTRSSVPDVLRPLRRLARSARPNRPLQPTRRKTCMAELREFGYGELPRLVRLRYR